MTTQGRAHLFQDSGPEAALQYLWQRLQARDLSRDEALAMLSALHEDLGRAQGRNPRLYAAYGQFMQALRHDMPQVHAYVLAKWEESHRPAGAPRAAADGSVAAAEASVADTGETKPVFVNRPSSLIPAPEWVPSKEEGPTEPWETDEDLESEEPAVKETQAQAPESGGEDPEPDEADLDEVQAGEQERLEDDDPTEAGELEAASEQEEAEQGERTEGEQAESDVAEDVVTEETEAEPEQQGGRAEAGSAEPSDESAGGEEGEWPAAEEAEPLEPDEGFESEESEEGEEGEEPAVD